MATFYKTTGLIGGGAWSGGTGNLDAIDGANLTAGDVALTYVSGRARQYLLKDSAGAVEDSPWVIIPDTNPGNLWWDLHNVGEEGVKYLYTDYAGDLSAALTAIGATETILVLDVANTVSADLTSPTTLTLRGVKGITTTLGDGVTLTVNGVLNLIEGGYFDGTAGGGTETLAINGNFSCGDKSQYFGNNITVTGLKNGIPNWWGLNTSPGSTDMTSAINSSLAACSTTNLDIETYNISDKLIIRPFTSLIGKNDGSSGTVIYQATGSDIAEAMIVSEGWSENRTVPDGVIVIRDIFLNGNKDGNSVTTHGIELMSWRTSVENVQVYGTSGDGIRFTDQNSNGVNLTATAVENKVFRCTLTQIDGSGIYTESNTSSLTDQKIIDNTIGSVGEYGIMAGAGAKVLGNHLYDIGFDGIATTDGFNNITADNSIQDWGQSATVGTRYGIVNYSIMDNNPCSISGNQVELSAVTAGSTYYAYGASFAAGVTTGLVTLSGNQAQLAGAERFFTATGTGTGTAELFGNTVQNAGATLIYPNANVVRYFGNGFENDFKTLTGSGTPSIGGGGKNFKTSSTNITYTNFTGGFVGQEINIVFAYAAGTGYVDFTGSSLKGNGGADWTFAQYDSMRCIYDGTYWYCNVS